MRLAVHRSAPRRHCTRSLHLKTYAATPTHAQTGSRPCSAHEPRQMPIAPSPHQPVHWLHTSFPTNASQPPVVHAKAGTSHPRPHRHPSMRGMIGNDRKLKVLSLLATPDEATRDPNEATRGHCGPTLTSEATPASFSRLGGPNKAKWVQESTLPTPARSCRHLKCTAAISEKHNRRGMG